MDSLIKTMDSLKIKNEIKELVTNEMVFELEELTEKWVNIHANNFSGGEMRDTRGSDIESFVRKCINFIGENENINLVAKRGITDLKVLKIGEIKKDHQVDVHIYLNDVFIAVIECKAYIDHCMYVRACDDFKIFKEFGYNLKNMIFAMEDSMKDNSKIFTDHVNKNICDECFFILDGKRSSSKPIYDSRFKKEINQQKVGLFVDYIYTLI